MRKKNTDIIRRARSLSSGNRGNGPVVYWMERDQRIEDNWALLFAQQEAIIRNKPLHIVFCLVPEILTWRDSQKSLLFHGILDLAETLPQYGLGFTILSGAADTSLLRFAELADPNLLVTDFSPLDHKQKTVGQLLKNAPSLAITEVDAHNIIPAWTVSPKKEYAAYTLRPKIHRLLPDFLTDFPEIIRHPVAPMQLDNSTLPLAHPDSLQNAAARTFAPGSKEGNSRLQSFIQTQLAEYDAQRNDPNANGQSGLSPYLHFGHLAPQRAALAAQQAGVNLLKDSFVEELVVRRELADNFCLYEKHYASVKGFPEWAAKTHSQHRNDARDFCYALKQLEGAETHEPLWNSCQISLVQSGKLHGFLRMYWAKKILEWTCSVEEALEYTIHLNDTYSLDGRDPNGYAGISWSLGGVHDRAWPERKIFGKVRYMNERGCRRKFNVDKYIAANPAS